MTDFVNFLSWKLGGAVTLAAGAVMVCGLACVGGYLLHRGRHGDNRKIPWKRYIGVTALCGYLAVLFYATLLRGDSGFHQSNFHLFRAWREAWNSFSAKNWLNVLLNVALFLPLGILPPLLSRRFRRWYWTIPLGLLLSAAIETVQYTLALGLADVDDVFCNTLGAALGYCLAMGGLALLRRADRRYAWAMSVPVLFCVGLASACLIYVLRPYGNLSLAASYRAAVGNCSWELAWMPDSSPCTATVYRAKGLDRTEADAFARTFFTGVGGELQDITYYDDSAYYADHRSPGRFLFVNFQDGGFTYSAMEARELPWAEYPEETARTALEFYGILAPDHAAFTYEGDGWHSFTLKQAVTETGMYDGQLRCRMNEAGQVREIEQFLHHYAACGEEAILSEQEALVNLQSGWFQEPYSFSFDPPAALQVHGVDLEYRIDTKGFYQPVYVFQVSVDGALLPGGLLIPALG